MFWDKFWGIKKGSMDNQCSANFMSNKDTMPDKAVLVTFSGFQYQECQRTFYLELLNSTSPITLSKLPQNIKNQDPNPNFTWSTAGTNNAF